MVSNKLLEAMLVFKITKLMSDALQSLSHCSFLRNKLQQTKVLAPYSVKTFGESKTALRTP